MSIKFSNQKTNGVIPNAERWEKLVPRIPMGKNQYALKNLGPRPKKLAMTKGETGTEVKILISTAAH